MLNREQALVKKIKEWSGTALIGDDCAVLPGGGLVTSDALVEGTHFRLDWTDWRRLGWKSCAVNLSDIAAMAGAPRHLTVALTLPDGRIRPEFAGEFLEKKLRDFYDGFLDCARSYRAELVGGDLTSGRDVVIAVTVFGETHENGVFLRSGARPGDVVAVTGDFGASAVGLGLLSAGFRPGPFGGTDCEAEIEAEYSRGEENQDRKDESQIPQQIQKKQVDRCIAAHLAPQPRLREGAALARLASPDRGEVLRGAMMDSSDGLADALCQLSEASGVAMNIDLNRIPVHRATMNCASLLGKADVDPLQAALYGGEDYELVLALSPQDWQLAHAKLHLTKIGEVLSGPVGQVRLFEGERPSERFSGVLDLNNTFKHFC